MYNLLKTKDINLRHAYKWSIFFLPKTVNPDDCFGAPKTDILKIPSCTLLITIFPTNADK